ncbi:precorrin-6y C5,15-methyltransferase (decarboxylating) subunit CbiE [Candidatus Pyrohabitans sp.]
MGKILVVGVGPGSEEYLTPAARRAIESASAFVGGENALRFAPPNKPRMVIHRNLEEVAGFIEKHSSRKVAVLTSGDATLFSILGFLKKRFPGDMLEVIPGISSVQLCFAKIKEPWNGARVISLHGRSFSAQEFRDEEKLVIMCDPRSPPQKIAEELLRRWGNRRCAVCENLSLPGERVVRATLEEISEEKFGGNSVVVVWR